MKVILKEEVLLNDFRDALLSMSKLKTHFKDNELYFFNEKKNKQTIQARETKRESNRCVISRTGITMIGLPPGQEDMIPQEGWKML